MSRRPLSRMSGDRRGVSVKGCLIAVAAVIVAGIALVVGILWWADSKIASQTAKPIDITPVADAEKVQSSLDTKMKETGGVVAASKEGTLTLTSDEFHMLVRQQMPDDMKDAFRMTLQGDLVQVQLPMKGAQLAQYIPPDLGTVRGYIAKLKYANLEVLAKVGFENGQWTIKVREVTRPVALAGSKIQGFVDGIKKDKAQGAVRMALGKDEVTLVSLEVKDSSAIARFTRQ